MRTNKHDDSIKAASSAFVTLLLYYIAHVIYVVEVASFDDLIKIETERERCLHIMYIYLLVCWFISETVKLMTNRLHMPSFSLTQ